MTDRKPWPYVWMDIAATIAKSRSSDPRLKVGCVIVPSDNTQVLAIGYNGDYTGGSNVPASLEPGKSEFLHAELNALIKCDFNCLKHKVMYVTTMPCKACASAIINASIQTVIWDCDYRDHSGIELLRTMGVRVINIHDHDEILKFVESTKKRK